MESIKTAIERNTSPSERSAFLGPLLEDTNNYVSQEGNLWDFKRDWPFSYSDEYSRQSALRELLDRAYGKPTQCLATDDDVIPEDMSAAELREELVAQVQRAFPGYRLLKVVPAPSESRRRRQSFTNEPSPTLMAPRRAELRIRH
jgi:hypothetical protein